MSVFRSTISAMLGGTEFRKTSNGPHALLVTTRRDHKNAIYPHLVTNYPMSERTLPPLSHLADVLVAITGTNGYEISTGWTRIEALTASGSIPVLTPTFTRMAGAAPGVETGTGVEPALETHSYFDGALIRNMPAAYCVAEATRLWPHRHIACVHSYGTGNGGSDHFSGGTNIVSWLLSLTLGSYDEDLQFAQLKLAMPGLEQTRSAMYAHATSGAGSESPPPSMVRVNVPQLASLFRMNVSSPRDIRRMHELTLAYVADNPDMILRMIEDLTPDISPDSFSGLGEDQAGIFGPRVTSPGVVEVLTPTSPTLEPLDALSLEV